MAKLNLASEFDMGSTKDTDNHKFQFLEETPFKEAIQGRPKRSLNIRWYQIGILPM